MKIFIGTDHAGFGLKEVLVPHLKNKGHEVVDKGAFKFDEADDYPDFIVPVAEEVSKDPKNSRGVILGATGQGEAICANEANIILRSREHNDANILSLGARYLTDDQVIRAVDQWLETEFSQGERHIRRLQKIEDIINK
jgi:ribose 5-phosphate isomerase B